MNRTFAILAFATLAATNVFAGSGDLIVDGNAGIGITGTPATKLDVYGTAQFKDVSGIATTVWSKAVTGAGGVGTSNNYPFTLLTNGVERLRVSTDGRVGIGVTSPATTLDVKVTYPSVTATAVNYSKGLQVVATNLPVSSGATDTGYRIGILSAHYTSDVNFQGTLEKQYGVWSRVGSYTTSPTGTINNSYALYLDNLDGGATVINKYGMYQASGSAKNYFAGKVGIGSGKTQPEYALDVYGQVRADNVFVTSDSRLKENVVAIDEAMEKLQALRGVSYTWKNIEANSDLKGGRHYGVIAQEIEKVLPEVVSTASDGIKAVAYTEIIPVLIEAIKEQQKQIEKQQQELAEIKKVLSAR